MHTQDPTKLQKKRRKKKKTTCTVSTRRELSVHLRIEQRGLCKNNTVAKGLVSLILERKESGTALEHGQYGNVMLITESVSRPAAHLANTSNEER